MKNDIKMAKVKWEEMLPHEFVAARDSFPVCWMPYGLAEPHGPYNALGLDWLKASTLVQRAAAVHGGIVAPPFAWHIQEIPEFHGDGNTPGWLQDAGVRQPLSSSIPSEHFYRSIFYHIRAIDARRFKVGILLTGHYGGLERTMRKICEFYTLRSGSPTLFCAIADNEAISGDLPYRGDHADICETSQLMALCPGLTDLSCRVCDDELGERFAGSVNFEKHPLPSREIGEQIVNSQIENLGIMARDRLSQYKAKEGWIAPDLNATTAMADEFIALTGKYWRISLAEYRAGKRYQFPDWSELLA